MRTLFVDDAGPCLAQQPDAFCSIGTYATIGSYADLEICRVRGSTGVAEDTDMAQRAEAAHVFWTCVVGNLGVSCKLLALKEARLRTKARKPSNPD